MAQGTVSCSFEDRQISHSSTVMLPYIPKVVVHIDFTPVLLLFDPRRIFGALQEANASGLQIHETKLKSLHQLALHLATRAKIIQVCVQNITAEQDKIIRIIGALPTRSVIQLDDSTVYSLLLYLDSFLFEIQAFDKNLLD